MAYELEGVEIVRDGFSLRIASCRLERGRIYAVVGPNGSGKTTFLNMLGLLERPAQGQLVCGDEGVDYSAPGRLLKMRRNVAYLMQNPYLFDMSVFDNIAYGLRLRGVGKKLIREKVARIGGRLSLEQLMDRNSRKLSGGEVQRVALARILVLDVNLFLLDEPTANVDRQHVDLVEGLIREVNREQGACVVMTTHSQDQAYRMSQHLISVIDGRIADVAYENVFSGVLEVEADGLQSVLLREGLRIEVAKGRPGRATVAIDPREVILSQEKLMSSALNRFPGKIVRIEALNGSLRVFVDVGVLLCALITARSFRDMELNVGGQVWATFKANAAHVIQ
jgi:tungstate transport system ATP-binding protein